MAADQGLADAQFKSGVCLEHGQGVSRDLSEAARYYKMAADQGVVEALQHCKDVLNVGRAEPTVTSTVSTDGHFRHDPRGASHLSDWIIGIGELEEVHDPDFGDSVSIRLFRRKEGNRQAIVGKFVIADNTDDCEKQFKREIESLFHLDHPCIVKFVGYALPSSLTDYRFLIFTEYVSGGSLSSVVEDPGRFPWFNSTSRSIIVVGIVLGMRYVHSRGILHRDLKPSNVLLDENHHPCLCDFGSSRDFSQESTMTGLPPVTLYYAAPELCNEDGNYNEKIDVYSFGILLYEIVTGKLALRHLNQLKLPVFISQGKRPEIPSSVLPFTRTLIERCWSGDPSERPSFNEIYDYLVGGDFRLFNDVDCLSVSAYSQSVCDLEKTSVS